MYRIGGVFDHRSGRAAHTFAISKYQTVEQWCINRHIRTTPLLGYAQSALGQLLPRSFLLTQAAPNLLSLMLLHPHRHMLLLLEHDAAVAVVPYGVLSLATLLLLASQPDAAAGTAHCCCKNQVACRSSDCCCSPVTG